MQEKQEKACDIEIKDEIVDGKACQELNMFKQYIRTQVCLLARAKQAISISTAVIEQVASGHAALIEEMCSTGADETWQYEGVHRHAGPRCFG